MEVDGCPFPDDRLYDLENDVWFLSDDGARSATIGITASLASFAGRFTRVTYRPVEGTIDRGRSVATLESVRFTGAVRLPVAGRVLERNELLERRPKLLNDSSYDRGWIVRVALEVDGGGRSELSTAASAREQIATRIRERRIRCYPAAPDSELYEIGAECSAVLAALDEEIANRAADEVVLLVTDDPTSPIELVRWADRSGHSLLAHRTEGTLHHFLVRREATPVPRRRGADPEPRA